MQTFLVMGDGPCADIDVPTYRSRFQWLGKRALSDANLVEEIVWASYSAPERAANGIRLTTERGDEVRRLLKQMVERTGTGRNVHVLMVDPKGKVIM